nr:ribonuclease E/G [Ilumatobacter sp.]
MDDINTQTGDANDASTGADATGGRPAEADAPETPAPGQASSPAGDAGSSGDGQRKRRRGSRGGQGRKKPGPKPAGADADAGETGDTATGADGPSDDGRSPEELPERIREGKVQDLEAAEQALVRKPKIGDTREPPFVPTKPPPGPAVPKKDQPAEGKHGKSGTRRRGKRGGKSGDGGQQRGERVKAGKHGDRGDEGDGQRKRRRGGRGRGKTSAAERELIEQRGGRERNGKPVGRYFMGVQVRPGMAQVAVLEGRNLIEHYVSRPADDISQIHGNIYLGRVQNVLPGMEAAFVDIATPKNAVLYRGDVQYDPEDIEEKGKNARIEDI